MTKAPISERINLRDPSGAIVELPASISPPWLAQLLHALRAQAMEMFREVSEVYLHREPIAGGKTDIYAATDQILRELRQ